MSRRRRCGRTHTDGDGRMCSAGSKWVLWVNFWVTFQAESELMMSNDLKRLVVADKKVYCHEALALHTKLQDAGYVAEPEPWDDVSSDSDSDASDGEDLDDSLLIV